MSNNKELTVLDIFGEYIRSDDKRMEEFLLVDPADRNVAINIHLTKCMQTYKAGDGRYPIATTRKHNIILGYNDPNKRNDGDDMITLDMKAYEDYAHVKMWDKVTCAKVAHKLSGCWDIICKYIGLTSIEVAMPDELAIFIVGHHQAICNVNKIYALAWANLLNAIRVSGNMELPDPSTIVGQNLKEVTEQLIRMAILQENLKGEKTVIKKSQVEANPLIKEAARQKIFSLAVDEIKADMEEDKPKVEA